MKTKKIIQKLSLTCLAIFSFVALSNAQSGNTMYYWDFNSTSGSVSVSSDSLGTAYSYTNTLHQDSLMHTLPLWANFSRKGHNVAKIVYTRPSANGILDNEDNANQEGGVSTPCGDSVLVGSHYYHGIMENGNLYGWCSWVNDLPLLSNDSGTGVSVPYVGSTLADENTQEAGNIFIRANNPATGSFMTFWMPTTNYRNIVFNFAQTTSSTGDLNYGSVAYTVNGGTTWLNLTRAMDTFNVSGNRTPDTIVLNNYQTGYSFWELRTLNFTSDPNTNNCAGFGIRFGYYGSVSGHNTRYDNFSLSGDSGTLGVNEVASIYDNVKVYPNPNNGTFTVSYTNSQFPSEAQTIEVYNVLGKNIYTARLNAANTQIDLSNAAAGVYLYKVIDQTGALVGEGKLVIQK